MGEIYAQSWITLNYGNVLQVANALISSAEKVSGGPSTSGSRLVVKCKHFLVLSLIIPKESDCLALIDTLIRCSRPSAFSIFAKT